VTDISDIKPKKKRANKILLSLLKLLLTAGMLWLVFTQADLQKIKSYAAKAEFLWLAIAFVVLNIGQIISSFRMRYYLASAGLKISRKLAISLYYAGMLFNLILPGGVSGDGYITWFIHKKMGFYWKTILLRLISGRGSGLLLLTVFALLLGFFSPSLAEIPYRWLLLSFALAGIFPAYSFLASFLLKEPVKIQIGAAKYSALVQGMSLLAAFFLLISIGHSGMEIDYLLLFLLSNIISILPISVGGVGLRELTFFYGSALFGLDAELGITISVLYFLVNTFASLFGVMFFYRLKMEGSK